MISKMAGDLAVLLGNAGKLGTLKPGEGAALAHTPAGELDTNVVRGWIKAMSKFNTYGGTDTTGIDAMKASRPKLQAIAQGAKQLSTIVETQARELVEQLKALPAAIATCFQRTTEEPLEKVAA